MADGIEFNRISTISPEVMQIIVRVYLSQVQAHVKVADTNRENSLRSLEEVFIISSSFWSTIRPRIPADERKKLDAFYYGTMKVEYDDIPSDAVKTTFRGKEQAILVLRDLWDIAARHGITMDFSYVLEGYENYGRPEG